MSAKKCTKCGEMKGFSEFYRRRNGDGLSPCCKICHKLLYGNPSYHRQREQRHAERIERELSRAQRGKRLVCWLEKNCSQCGEAKPLTGFRVDSRRFDGRSGACLVCRPNKPGSREPAEILAARWARYSRTDAYREWRRVQRRRERVDPAKRLNHRMSRGIWQSIRTAKGGHPWQELVGYSLDALRAHLESRFLPGMSWKNFGQWHIDHARPLASFSFIGPADPDFRAAWALSNLQPLWALDNIRKGARYASSIVDSQRACS